MPRLSGEAPLLVGRERELGVLRQHLDAAIGGHGSLVLIGGEAGVGKTALCEAVHHEIVGRRALVLVGRCFDLVDTPPYGPLIDLFLHLPDTPEMPPLPAAFAERGTVGVVVSQLALLAQFEVFLKALTARQPVVILLEDLHWADAATLDLLTFLARALATLPVLLLVTYRSDELTRRHPLYALLPQLARESAVARLDLGRLDDGAVRALVLGRYLLPEADTARLVRYLRQRAEGNGLFVGELLRDAEETGVLRHEGGDWRLGDLDAVTVPRLLKQVIDARIARLDEEGRELLEVAAVIGHTVPYALWAEAARADEEAVLDLAERAEAARVLEEGLDGAGMHFAHALVREALYEGLASVRRRRLHRRVGEALAGRRNPDPDMVAFHLRRANDPRALPWLIAAGERAQRAYARLTAADRFEAALEIFEAQGAEAEERGWMLLELALLRRYSDHRKALTFLTDAARAAAEAGDAFLAASVRCSRGLLYCYAGDVRVGIALIAEAVDALDALPPLDASTRERAERMGIATDPEHHRGLLALWLANIGEYARARALAEWVVAHMPPLRTATMDTAFAPDAYRALGLVHAAQGRPDEAQEMFARNAEAYRHIGDELQMGYSLGAELHFVALPYRTDDIAGRRRLGEEIAARVTGAAAAAAGLFPPAVWTIPLLVLEGRWDEVRPLLRAARGGPIPAALEGPFARSLGDTDAARAVVAKSFPDGPPPVGSWPRFLYAAILVRLGAELALDDGDLAAADAWLAAHDGWLAWSGAVLGQSEGQALWARYYRQSGDLANARARAERALAHACEPRQPLALIAVHRLLGELDVTAGQYGDAAAHLDATLTLADACAAPFERALTLLAMAELRAATGDADTVRPLLDEVRAICTPLAATPTLTRADALAARLAVPPDASAAYPDGLSTREVEVLHLIAAGLSNQEIADTLSISIRTVERHITNLYAKIGADGRADATAYALRHHLA